MSFGRFETCQLSRINTSNKCETTATIVTSSNESSQRPHTKLWFTTFNGRILFPVKNVELPLSMGVNHGETGRQVPRIWSRGEAGRYSNCPRRFCHTCTKRSVLWPSKYAKIRFWPALCPGPRWGSSRCSLRPLVGWEEDTSSIPYPTWHRPTFGARHASPEFQPDLRLCRYHNVNIFHCWYLHDPETDKFLNLISSSLSAQPFILPGSINV